MRKEEGKNAIFSVSFPNKKEKWKREEMNSLFRSPFQKRKIEREKKGENQGSEEKRKKEAIPFFPLFQSPFPFRKKEEREEKKEKI